MKNRFPSFHAGNVPAFYLMEQRVYKISIIKKGSDKTKSRAPADLNYCVHLIILCVHIIDAVWFPALLSKSFLKKL